MNKFDQLLKEAGIPRANGYHFYFKNYIFKDIDLKNKKIMDLGGGNGRASFFALSESPSCTSCVVDPLTEGSNNLMLEQFNYIKKKFAEDRIKFHQDFIDSLLKPEIFDIVLMHNSINHIGEDIIEKILTNNESYNEYKKRIKPIFDRLTSKGILIVSDCGTFNFLGNLGFKNPIAPTINWKIHCEPNIWQKMIEGFGFRHIRTEWTARREFGNFGRKFLSNRICSYFLNSHFVSVYEKF